jgi:serine/threonine-protein kinase
VRTRNLGERSTLRLDAAQERESGVHWSFDVAYAAGDVIAGRYELEALLGAGGMGAVFRARDRATDTRVAIKLATNACLREELTARMREEAQLEARLRHPGIVRALDFGVTEARDAFIVMELLEGCSLRELIAQRGRLSPEEALRLMLPIAEALCFVHACGVLHRDVKPDNIFIAKTAHGVQPKLLDFGIAKQRRGGAWTRDGALVGSPGYMAPEQARALPDLDERADVWSFCVVLYEAMAGAAAMHAPELETMLPSQAFTLDLRPSLQDMAGSFALLQVVERGLAHERDQRFQSMWDVTRALRAAAIPRRPRTRRFITYPLVA